jgi:chloramphenicol O-acetyltransferase type A
MSYKVLDPETWNRKEHYHFFKSFEEPFTGVIADVDVGQAFQYCKTEKISFFQYYLHKSIIAVNKIKALRLRIIADELRLYDQVDVSATLSRLDGTFGFSFIEYDKNFERFKANVKSEMDRIQASTGLFPPNIPDSAVVHYSAMPWIRFKGLSHARKYSIQDSSPKITFGKVYEDWKGIRQMPVSVHAHHALVDGRDIAEYYDLFQKYMSNN